MEKLKKHKKLTAVLVVIAAILVGASMLLPSFAATGEDLIKAASANGSAANSDAYKNKNRNQHHYSSWDLPKQDAFEVDPEYATKLRSNYSATKYAPTKVEASGNTKTDVKCVLHKTAGTGISTPGKTYTMDPDDGPIFRLSDSKSGNGVILTYKNLYIYDPDDSGALTKGKAHYVPVDLKVTVTYFDEKVHNVGSDSSKSISYTDKPYIQFSNTVKGLPSIWMYNVDNVNVKYSYTYGDASSKAGQTYKIKTNMTYDDIDAGQAIGLRDDNASYYVAKNTKLDYAQLSSAGSSYDVFYGETPENIDSSNNTAEIPYSFGQTYSTTSQTIKYVSSSATNGKLTGAPLGSWTYFGASAYSMVKLVAPKPTKDVSDDDSTTASYSNGKVTWGSGDDENAETNGVGSPKSSWTYSVEQIIPGGSPKAWRYDSIQFDDQISKLLKINSVKVMCDSTNATKWFDISTTDNHVVAKLKDSVDESQLSKIYNSDDTSLRLVINVSLDRSLTMQDYRGANALVADSRGDEGAIHITNTASTTIKTRSETGKLADKVNTNTTNTYVKVPSINDPSKKITDSDEKNTDHNIITLFDDEPFQYDVYHKVESDQIHFDHYMIYDKVDPCIHVHTGDSIKVYDENGNDRSSWFDISVDHQDASGTNQGLNTAVIKAEATSAALANDDFYGHTYDLRWTNDLKSETKYKDQGITKEYWEQKGYLNKTALKLTVPNKAQVIIDKGSHTYPSYIDNGSTVDISKSYTKDTNQVDTTIYLPNLKITKAADKYEYQVGDKIHYTIHVQNLNSMPDSKNKANYVIVKDTDFPSGLKIDEKSYKVSGFNSSLKEPDGSTRAYTIKNVDGGFQFSTRYLQYGEDLTIEFDATADKTTNGTHVKNTAVVSSDGVDDKSDQETVYINSPKMDVQKSVSEDRATKEGETPVYKVGDTINYKVVVKNINKGTFARNMVFNDKITTNAGETPGVKIDSNSIKVYDLNMNPYTEGSTAEGTSSSKGDYTVSYDSSGNGFTINFTKPNMGYYEDTTIPAVTKSGDTESASSDASINANYNFEKNYKNLNLMKGYIVTYSASVTDSSLAGKTIDNTAVSQPGKNTNGDEIKNDPNIPSGKGEDEKNVKLQGDSPSLKITKNSDKRTYNVGDTGHYTVTVTNPEKGTTAKNVIIKDQFDLTGMEIDKSSIKVAKNGTDITGQCGIDTVQTGNSADNSSNSKVYNGYIITPKGDDANLSNGDKYTVTYDVKFTSSSLAGKNIRNVARATSDNCTDVTTEDATPVDVGSDLTAVKTSYPISGTIVKGGKAIKYTVTVNNTSKEDKTNVMVRDMIPTHTTFVSSDDGKVMKIGDKNYFTARIKSIAAGKSASVSFIVKVDEDAADTDIIHNVAEVHKATSDELVHDNDFPNNIPDSLFTTASFNPTNATDHPLRYWVQADNTVTIPGGGTSTTDNPPTIKKTVKQTSYSKGDTLNYTVNVSGKSDLVNPEIKDEIKDQKATINKDSIKVEKISSSGTSTDITKSVTVNATDYGYTITTKPSSGSFTLSKGDTLKVTYTATASASSGNIENTASTKDDNNPTWISDTATVPPKDTTDNPPVIQKTVKQSSYKAGDTLNYTVNVNSKRDLINPEIKDQIKDQKAKINQDSIKVELVEGNTATDITGKVTITKADYSYDIVTKPSSGNYTLKTGDTIRVTYTATAQDVNGNIENTASTKDDNHPTWVDDTVNVPQNTTQPTIKKTVAQTSYKEGDTLNYTVKVTAPRDLINPQIKDEIKDQKAAVDKSSIKVTKVSSTATSDITSDVTVNATDYGYTITTKPSSGSFTLSKGDSIVVTYTAKAGKINGNIENTASTKDDNNPTWISDTATVPPVDTNNPALQIAKSVKESSFKKGDTLHYTVKLTAANGTVKNVALSDAFDEDGISYDQKSVTVLLDGNDITSSCTISFNGKGMTIKTGKDLEKDKTLTVTYGATVNKDIKDTIKNTATGSGDNVDKVTADASVPPTSGSSSTPSGGSSTPSNGSSTPSGSSNGGSGSTGSTGGSGGSQLARSNVQTGDNYNYIWIGIFLAALAASAGYVIYRRKHR
jgi:fimbrial isopeptide formation D2 family protein/uncharacterized repeat protein (TIGR01451 family)